jgi:Bacterial SH3 domain
VRGLHRSLVGAALAALLGASMARAESATTKERARLRRGPSGASELVAELPPGTALDVLGESGGWKQVRARDGKTGYVWAEHLAEAETPPAEGRAAPRSLADEVRDLHQEVSTLAQRPEPASAADLERVRRELERLSAAERDLARRFDERFVGGPAPADPAPEWTFGAVAALLALGTAIGLFADRLLQRRRDGRQRSRHRL